MRYISARYKPSNPSQMTTDRSTGNSKWSAGGGLLEKSAHHYCYQPHEQFSRRSVHTGAEPPNRTEWQKLPRFCLCGRLPGTLLVHSLLTFSSRTCLYNWKAGSCLGIAYSTSSPSPTVRSQSLPSVGVVRSEYTRPSSSRG